MHSLDLLAKRASARGFPSIADYCSALEVFVAQVAEGEWVESDPLLIRDAARDVLEGQKDGEAA